MADGPRYSVPFRRRREGRTDYKLRRALVRSGKPRAVVRVTNKYVYVQITDAELRGDIVRAAASSKELAKMGWKGASGNIPSASLTGGYRFHTPMVHYLTRVGLVELTFPSMRRSSQAKRTFTGKRSADI